MHRTKVASRQGFSRTLAGAALVSVMLGVGSLSCTVQDSHSGSVAVAPPSPAARASAPMPESEPVSIEIPTLGVTSEVMDLGLQPDGSMEVPPGAYPAGWYTGAPTPGEVGPAVVAAHVDWKGEPGVFFEIDELEPGQEVTISRRDGSVAVFRVNRVDQYPRDQFPTETVYGDIGHAGLRLITCGGDFDDEASSYKDNVVVYASLVGSSSV